MDEKQTESEAPRLVEIAASILSGLLASGDYTEMPDRFRPNGESKGARYRPEAVSDAIRLAQLLMEGTRTVAVIYKRSQPVTAAAPMSNVGNPKVQDTPA